MKKTYINPKTEWYFIPKHCLLTTSNDDTDFDIDNNGNVDDCDKVRRLWR